MVTGMRVALRMLVKKVGGSNATRASSSSSSPLFPRVSWLLMDGPSSLPLLCNDPDS